MHGLSTAQKGLQRGGVGDGAAGPAVAEGVRTNRRRDARDCQGLACSKGRRRHAPPGVAESVAEDRADSEQAQSRGMCLTRNADELVFSAGVGTAAHNKATEQGQPPYLVKR